jgi:hypothetical protein
MIARLGLLRQAEEKWRQDNELARRKRRGISPLLRNKNADKP